MKETLICSLTKHNIYYLNDSNCAFFISVPMNNEYQSTNIAVRLKSNYESYDLSRNQLGTVTEEVVNYYKELDNFNITLLLPILYDASLSRARNVRDVNLYQNIDKFLAHMFNNAYTLLSKNGIKVDDKIFVIENKSFEDFTNWYVNRYNSRIEYKTLAQLVKENGSYRELEKKEGFIVGKNQEPKIDKTVEIEVETFDNYVKQLNEEKPKTRVRTPDNAGFVSYILLGIVVFGISILLLSALLK